MALAADAGTWENAVATPAWLKTGSATLPEAAFHASAATGDV
jgi:hypothetical protein